MPARVPFAVRARHCRRTAYLHSDFDFQHTFEEDNRLSVPGRLRGDARLKDVA